MRRTIAPALLLASALAASCCGNQPPPPAPAGAAATAPAPDDGFAAPAPELGVEHAFCVADGVFRGSQPEKGQLKALRDAGIRTLVSLRTSKPMREEAEALGMAVVEVPIEAALDSDPPSEEQVKLFFETVLDPARRPVYFHCLHGRDRTGTMAALYRIEVDGWPSDRAILEMKHLGFRTWYQDLLEFVRDYKPRGFRAPGR